MKLNFDYCIVCQNNFLKSLIYFPQSYFCCAVNGKSFFVIVDIEFNGNIENYNGNVIFDENKKIKAFKVKFIKENNLLKDFTLKVNEENHLKNCPYYLEHMVEN